MPTTVSFNQGRREEFATKSCFLIGSIVIKITEHWVKLCKIDAVRKPTGVEISRYWFRSYIATIQQELLAADLGKVFCRFD